MRIQQFVFVTLCFTLSTLYGFAQDIPQVEISNGLVNAKLYLPDPDNGYYRATRFDWSGVIPHLEHDGHTYFGKWFKHYDPKVHESIMGPVEAFAAIGYEEAQVGENFLKIGVGTLIKPAELEYSKFKTYDISNHGTWFISKKSNSVEFKHILNTEKFSYEYVKHIVLPTGESELVINHEFTNTGNKTLETTVFNHNFFFIDNKKIGKGYNIKFPYKINTQGRVKGINEFAKIENSEIRFIKGLQEGEQVYIESIKGYDMDAMDYHIQIENKNTGAGVKIHGGSPLSKLIFWSAHKTVCPEPYINIKANPGETITWKIIYTFYSL